MSDESNKAIDPPAGETPVPAPAALPSDANPPAVNPPAAAAPPSEPTAVGGPSEPASSLPPAEPAAADAAVAESAAEEVEEDDVEEEVSTSSEPLEYTPEISREEAAANKDWYILKVQSNRENSIADALRRRVKVAGLDDYFEEILVPTEDVVEYKMAKKRVVKRKIYPGYIVVKMAITDETWFLVRETPGIGDFTGAAGKPSKMLPKEVERILPKPADTAADQVKTMIPFKQGDRVRIKEGTFENFEGHVDAIDEANGRVTVMINIFGRSTPTELEHWQIEEI